MTTEQLTTRYKKYYFESNEIWIKRLIQIWIKHEQNINLLKLEYIFYWSLFKIKCIAFEKYAFVLCNC